MASISGSKFGNQDIVDTKVCADDASQVRVLLGDRAELTMHKDILTSFTRGGVSALVPALPWETEADRRRKAREAGRGE